MQFVPMSPAEQVAAKLRREIQPLDPGTLLPSLRTYAERFGVSPATVAKALRSLAADGLVVSRQGLGTYRA